MALATNTQKEIQRDMWMLQQLNKENCDKLIAKIFQLECDISIKQTYMEHLLSSFTVLGRNIPTIKEECKSYITLLKKQKKESIKSVKKVKEKKNDNVVNPLVYFMNNNPHNKRSVIKKDLKLSKKNKK